MRNAITTHGGGFTARDGLVQEYVDTTGAVLAGRSGLDSAIGDSRPYGAAWEGPVFVLTHHPEDAPPAEGINPGGDAIRLALVNGGEPTAVVNVRYRPLHAT